MQGLSYKKSMPSLRHSYEKYNKMNRNRERNGESKACWTWFFITSYKKIQVLYKMKIGTEHHQLLMLITEDKLSQAEQHIHDYIWSKMNSN